MKIHHRFLLHYLLHSGRPMKMPQDLLNYTILEYHYPWMWKVGVPQIINAHDDFNYAVGKFIAMTGYDSETGDKAMVAFDRYIFYAWCSTSDHFSHNCTCPKSDSDWAHVQPLYEWAKPFNKIRDHIYNNSWWESHERLSNLAHRVLVWWVKLFREKISISDKFWVHLGKPFYSYGYMEVQ